MRDESQNHFTQKISLQQSEESKLWVEEFETLKLLSMQQSQKNQCLDWFHPRGFFPFDEAAIKEIENSYLATKPASNMVANEYVRIRKWQDDYQTISRHDQRPKTILAMYGT